MSRFTITASSPTGTIHTVDCNSASEALGAEGELAAQGYTVNSIDPA